MTAVIMHGAPVADAVLADVAERVAKLNAEGAVVGLGTILVGDDPASARYVGMKQEACARVGMTSRHVHIPSSGTQADLLAAIRSFNQDPGVDAFLVQNPVPQGFDYNQAMLAVDPAKDVDGLHPVNLGLLALGDAAVTVVHTGVADMAAYTRQADILVGAAGVPGIIQPDMVRPGAVVVGGGQSYEGRRVLSDVDESVAEVAGWITPRIGGVGPTTVAMLLRNAVDAATRRSAG
ncbi:MAG: bifunctional 5,10-methylenetetrahydrofolate dehydrogenase/5,10-methenyltetrahydrofolate cyclohydrolase [Actinobacteria bacterium]|nr:bifunctional 5,10-methylenetetrahydrofolate dehydrogenase/5,10-methenyltetrahydrofolate cyclohydrolase [Actinomycetota bacterium]